MERYHYGTKKLIGGEFELNSFPSASINGLNKLTHCTGTWTTNGRSALYLILQKLKSKGINQIHLPAFLCQSILQPVLALDLDYTFYPVQPDLTAEPDPPKNSAVLLIHYFGFINNAAEGLRKGSGNDYHLIEDASHVFLNEGYFNEVENQVFFSLRKHGPTVLGGWCNLDLNLDDPYKDIEICTWKSLAARLMKGLYLNGKDVDIDLSKENFYLELFGDAEKLLDSGIHPTRPPQIIFNLIESLQWEDISKRRRTNWQTLYEIIGEKFDPFPNHLPDGAVPLGYMICLKDRDTIKEKLAARRIFAPIHWPLSKEIDKKIFPESIILADSLLTLPIDQRYGTDDMNYIAGNLKEMV